MNKVNLHIILLLFVGFSALSQEPEKNEASAELRGYLSNMQSVMISDVNGRWINDNLFHNRLNLFFYSGNLTGSIQLRNRFMYGQSIFLNPTFPETIDNEQNFLDMSMNLTSGESYYLNASVDRIYLEYTTGKFVFTAGRQRINWGQTMVWNPNDVFNVQNYFDFDYPEKPGSDALRIQYYPDYTSTAEIAAKLDNNHRLTAAGFYRFNKWRYDIQFLGGILSEEDVFGGFGWSGDIKGAGFRGELSYFQPLKNFQDTSGVLIASVSLDYTFSNSLYLQFESLFSEKPEGQHSIGFYDYYQGNLNVKKMSFSEWNIFFHASYPVTPLLTTSFSAMYFPDLRGIYAGPSVSYSLTDNSQLSILSQIFNGKFTNPLDLRTEKERNTIFFGFIRYKFSF